MSIAGNDALVQDQFDTIGTSTARALEKVFDVVVAGQIFETDMGPINAAIGAQYRDTHYEQIGDSLSAAGEANEEGILTPIDSEQEVVAFFGEVIVPFHDRAELQLAARYEDYGSGLSNIWCIHLSAAVFAFRSHSMSMWLIIPTGVKANKHEGICYENKATTVGTILDPHSHHCLPAATSAYGAGGATGNEKAPFRGDVLPA